MTDSPGTVIISDASNMRGQRSLNFGYKRSFGPFIELRMAYTV